MAGWYDSEGRIFELRLAPLGHVECDIGVVLYPNDLDRNIECLELRQMLGVSGVFIEELRRQLHEGGARAGLSDEVLTDQRADERIEMGLLHLGQGVQELLLLPFQQQATLLAALRHRHRHALHAPSYEHRYHLRPK